MAQYYNIVTDNSVPITVDDVQQLCEVDGQRFHLVLQDMNNGANGGPSLLTYSTSDINSASFPHQVVQNQSTTVNSGQNVFIINTEPMNTDNTTVEGSELISVKESSKIVRSNSKGPMSSPNERQDVQWVNAVGFKNQSSALIKNQTQKTALALAHLAQGTSDKLVGTTPKSRNRFPTPELSLPAEATDEINSGVTRNVFIHQPTVPTFRLKSSSPGTIPPKPLARAPIRPDNSQLRPAMVPGTVKNPLLNNQPLDSLSERIKQARNQTRRNLALVQPQPSLQNSNNVSQKPPRTSNRNQRAPVTPQRHMPPLNIQQHRPLPPCPASPDSSPDCMRMPYPNYSPEKSNQGDLSTGDCDSGSESFAYLQKVIDNPANAIVQQQISGNVVKMLVVLPSGEQRLITFDIPNEECTVQDLLEQAKIPFNGQTVVSLVSDTKLNINYIVESEAGVIATMRDTSDPSDSSETASTVTDESNTSSTIPHEEPKFIDGRLAVCPNCGISSMDFNRCVRCRKKLPSDVKQIPMTVTQQQQKKEALIAINKYYSKQRSDQGGKIERELMAKRPRGRAKLPPKMKPMKEPECLTLSSDEEEDGSNSGNKKCEPQINPMETQMNIMSEIPEMISDKEPIITNHNITLNSDGSINPIDTNPRNDGNNGDRHSDDLFPTKISTSLICRTVRIGSYKYIPRDKITINQSGLMLAVPLLEDSHHVVKIQVNLSDIVKVLIHFGKGMPVLFFYTTPNCGAMIREVLGMQDSKGPYYDPAGKDHTHKRITLLPEKISEESKHVCKTLFLPGGRLEELNSKEANDILVRASPKTNPQMQNMIKRQSTATSGNVNATNGRPSQHVVQKMTVYPPPPAKSGITINTEDYSCLGEDQFLNDVIIDFYLKYLTLEVLSNVDQQRTHVFSSYFYKRLTSRHAQAPDNNVSQTPATKRHARVQKWTKNVNIFEKDFVIIPINEHAHWFLAIICFPGLVGTVIPPSLPVKDLENKKKKKKDVKLQAVTIGNTTITPVATTITIDPADDDSERDEAEGDDDEMDMDSEDDEEEARTNEGITVESAKTTENSQPESTHNEQDTILKYPCILIFDSLAGASRSRVVATLRDYLSCEYMAKVGQEKIFSKDTIKGCCPKVPQQSNFTDCGLYLLQYVESFFKDPIRNYTLPIKTLKNWFEEIIVTRKREELSNLLIKLMNETKGDKTINLPTVQFPTQDGKLKPKPENLEKPEQKIPKAELEVKKKAADEESLGNSSQNMNEPPEEGESQTNSRTIYKVVTYSPGLSSSSGDGNTMEMYVEAKPKTTSAVSTMAYLRNKRISRLITKEEAQENQATAKKHKGDSLDSCK
ncbi:uncharacterized protein [Chelonus insularis]|uniref:uncharacterized protein isoform X1 n=2 Tax=Chelonus insularis TaxID=460826 RepID=UPI00158871AA|nr:uncharacterized protein LOC118068675 isoform X1 [Chelonus insularis]XP_034942142.1 uncharacterized protein LOC118068675 isoform X1 [Chelonus insularis]XP_034942143.1 uncharacterized protein LOC118068675 isoform X1 [Chelonus insularis]XP_034942144.1 uncharacterized protein LOC118068675 isoform X1 [Chelonus insularis]XP_034942145.1 uncharacterized protein LOC118068675 isoform X1 [Chelonus insularis]XP_034942146.1 uncharacterized protein LOC118068675 isoform X1 [Chelonus insularis]XP_03494214